MHEELSLHTVLLQNLQIKSQKKKHTPVKPQPPKSRSNIHPETLEYKLAKLRKMSEDDAIPSVLREIAKQKVRQVQKIQKIEAKYPIYKELLESSKKSMENSEKIKIYRKILLFIESHKDVTPGVLITKIAWQTKLAKHLLDEVCFSSYNENCSTPNSLFYISITDPMFKECEEIVTSVLMAEHQQMLACKLSLRIAIYQSRYFASEKNINLAIEVLDRIIARYQDQKNLREEFLEALGMVILERAVLKTNLNDLHKALECFSSSALRSSVAYWRFLAVSPKGEFLDAAISRLSTAMSSKIKNETLRSVQVCKSESIFELILSVAAMKWNAFVRRSLVDPDFDLQKQIQKFPSNSILQKFFSVFAQFYNLDYRSATQFSSVFNLSILENSANWQMT